ncbi:MAG: DUF885 domain-containing protein [Blautia sp.]|nr:DUF885 domain-containing protein [Blautia sp.]
MKLSRKKSPVLIAASLILALFLGLWGLPKLTGKDGDAFNQFLSQMFVEEVSSNTINLHFTLSNPAAVGIRDYDVTFGDFSKEARQKSILDMRELRSKLEGYSYRSMSTDEKLVYDVLTDYLDRQLTLSDYALYDEVLTPSGGATSQLPILLAEYRFNSRQDVEDYLALLSQMDTYFAQLLAFEQEKADAGLFMSDRCCGKVIESCEVFLNNPTDNFLVTTFDNRLAELEGLSGAEVQAYSGRNREAIAAHVIPAYQSMATGLTRLMGKGRNNWGLCHYENGKDYYAALVAYYTGCDDSVEELAAQIEEKRNADLTVCGELLAEDPGLLTAADSATCDMQDETMMIKHLQNAMLEDFPEAPESKWEVCHVDESLSEYLAPAFYITAPIDNYLNNRIYINDVGSDSLYLFTTLAHEGFPGHLYQTVQSYSYGMNPMHTLLNYPGYIEGWATYVEMQAYYYAGLDENLASLLQHNQSSTLSLYATSDIGIHYLGWESEDMLEFWGGYGISDADTVNAITNLILDEPGNYLKYYVGYLKFDQLREACEEKEGSSFDPVKFHEEILQTGPAPFSLLEEKLLD